MVANRVRFGRGKTFAFGCDHVQELRAFQLTDVLQGFHQQGQVVAVDGANIVEPQLLKQCAGRNHTLEMFFGFLCQGHQVRGAFEHLLAAVAHLIVGTAGEQLGEIVGKPADVA